MNKKDEQTNAQKAIMERIRIKNDDSFCEIYEDHVDSYVL